MPDSTGRHGDPVSSTADCAALQCLLQCGEEVGCPVDELHQLVSAAGTQPPNPCHPRVPRLNLAGGAHTLSEDSPREVTVDERGVQHMRLKSVMTEYSQSCYEESPRGLPRVLSLTDQPSGTVAICRTTANVKDPQAESPRGHLPTSLSFTACSSGAVRVHRSPADVKGSPREHIPHVRSDISEVTVLRTMTTLEAEKMDSPRLRIPRIQSTTEGVAARGGEELDSPRPLVPRMRSVTAEVAAKEEEDSPRPKVPRMRSVTAGVAAKEEEEDSPRPKVPRMRSVTAEVAAREEDSPRPKVPRMRSVTAGIAAKEEEEDSPRPKVPRMRSVTADVAAKEGEECDTHPRSRDPVLAAYLQIRAKLSLEERCARQVMKNALQDTIPEAVRLQTREAAARARIEHSFIAGVTSTAIAERSHRPTGAELRRRRVVQEREVRAHEREEASYRRTVVCLESNARLKLMDRLSVHITESLG